jgi:DNA-repair protein complementing XP-A cells
MEGGFLLDDEEPALPTAGFAPTVNHAPLSSRPQQEEDHDEEGEAALAELERDLEGGGSAAGAHSTAAAEIDVEDRPKVLGKCVECRQVNGQAKFFDAFGVSVCYECQRAAKGAGGKYQVVAKCKAKDEYLLTDRQLDRERGGLGCLTQANPHDSRYGDMRLYLRTQVEELALGVWGSDEALFVEKERRSQERLQRAETRKRKAAANASQPGGRGVTKPGSARRAEAAAAALARRAAESHTHDFLPDEEYDVEADLWTKRCACGFEVKYERI